VGFTSEWTSIFISGAGSNAAVAIAFAMAITRLTDLGPVAIKVIAVAAILVLSAVNYRGVKFGAMVQNVFTVSKVIPLILILLWGIFGGKQTPDLSLAAPAGVSFGGIIMMIAVGVMTSMWAYEGWTNLNAVAEEIKNPQKNLPRAIIIALSSITVVYVLFNFAIYRILPAGEVSSFINDGQVYLGTEAAMSLWGTFGFILVAVTMMISMFGCLNGCIMAFPREYYAVSKDGHFIPSFSRLHPIYGTPHVSIISQCIISIILVIILDLYDLTALVVFASILYKMLTVFAVLIYRKKQPNTHRPYRVPLTYVTVPIATLSMLGLLVSYFQGNVGKSLFGLLVPISGAVVYFIFFNKKK
jgi:APA family basic amino acid/polyamine antiporter